MKSPTTETSRPNWVHQPEFFRLSQREENERWQQLITKFAPQLVDTFSDQLEELCQIRHVDTLKQPVAFQKALRGLMSEIQGDGALAQAGVWVYYPWRNTMVHCLEEDLFYEVRTARNKYLISPADQRKFAAINVGVAGLSVGHAVALTLILEGGVKILKLADFDTLSLSNLNRVRVGLCDLGLPKTIVAARKIMELNPFQQVILYDKGIINDSIDDFFQDLDVVVDEIDNLAMKVQLRFAARLHQIPLIMSTDNGDGIILDVERYDIEPNQDIFLGRLGQVNIADFSGELSREKKAALATKIVGPSEVVAAMKYSLGQIGQTIPTWPNLGGAAQISGAAVTEVIRKISGGLPVKNGRFYLQLNP